MGISSLKSRYLDYCRSHEVLPNSSVLSWFSKNSCPENLRILVLLNQLKDSDISPLIDTFLSMDSADIDVIDIFYESPCNISGESIMSLLRAINLKLKVVDIQDMLLEEEFLRDLCHHGLACQVLNLRSMHIQKLNMAGSFMQLQTLNLDFCNSITSLHKNCFSCMPNLMHLSMCGTRIANLWTTTAALVKLPSLVELRFQNCLCCKDTGQCRSSFGEKANLAKLNMSLSSETSSVTTANATFQASHADAACGNLLSFTNSYTKNEVDGITDHSSDTGEVEVSSCLQRIDFLKISSNDHPNLNGQLKLQNKIQGKHNSLTSVHTWDLKNSTTALKNFISHHPSPICFEKHYREYMVSSLTGLKVLDNVPIDEMERQMARTIFSKYYEYLPYKHQHRESVVSILWKREIGASGVYCQTFSKPMQPHPYGNSPCFFRRSLGAAKLGSVGWPLLNSLSSFSYMHQEENKRLRPRQFEYHPSDSSLMVFGTLDGEIVVINHENGKMVGYVPSTGAMNSVLGLCWLKKYPSKLLAGSDDGCLKLFDVNNMPPKVTDYSCRTGAITFDDFEQLTSVNVNSTDDQFLASGYSKDVALYDINREKRLQLFTNLHREPINVAKFANHSPFLFATSSFDRDVKLWDLRQKPEHPCYKTSSTRGNVMVCFSPDDHYLLVSAVDNEVKQLLAADGRLHMNFDIASTGSAHNYTRSYYMNGGDYIISGSCDEHVVRICCAQSGRRLRDVYLEGSESGNPLFVQSLRGDPFRFFHMSILTASKRPTSKWEIIKVNLLTSTYDAREYSCGQQNHSSSGLGS